MRQDTSIAVNNKFKYSSLLKTARDNNLWFISRLVERL